MPAFGSQVINMTSGDRIAILNSENLAANGITAAITLAPQPVNPRLAIYNNTSQTVGLVASPDVSSSADFFLVSNGSTAISIPTHTVVIVEVAAGLFYAITSASAITAGTVWITRA